jgi:hypothetical protein
VNCRGRFGLERSGRAPIDCATFRAWLCGGKLAIRERYRMAGLRGSMASAGKAKDGWHTITIGENSNVDFDFAADTVQEP